MKANPPARNWLVIVFLIGVGAAYVTLIDAPSRKATAAVRREIDEKRQFLMGTAQLATALAAVQSDLTKTTQYVDSVGTSLPRLGGEAKVLSQIHALAATTGVTIARFEPEVAVRRDSIAQMPVALTVTGPFARIHEFVNRIEQLPVRIWVEQIKCSRAGKVSMGEKDVAVEISLAVFADNSEESDYAKLDERPINGRTR